MKKTISVICILLMLGAMFAGCASSTPTARITGLASDTEVYTLGVGESVPIGLAMSAEVTTSDGTTSTHTLIYGEDGFAWPEGMDEAVTSALASWTEVNPVFDVADKSVVTVEKDTIITHAAGETTITASVTDPSGETVNATLAVTVVQYVENLDVNVDNLELTFIDEPEPAEDSEDKEAEKEVTEDEDSADKTPANTAQIVAQVWPENSSDPTITFTSSDDAVVLVDDNATVIATGIGEAEIMVTAPGGKDEIIHIIKVTVTVPTPAVFAATEGKESVSATSGKGFQFPLDLGNENPEDFTILYESSDPSVVSVSESGWCDSVGVGETELTASVPHTDLVVVIVVTVQPAPANTGGNRGGGNNGSGGSNGETGSSGATDPGNNEGATNPGNGGGNEAPAPTPNPPTAGLGPAEAQAAASAALGVGGFADYSGAPCGGNYAGWSVSNFGSAQDCINMAVSQAQYYATFSGSSTYGRLHAWADGSNFYVGVSEI